MKIFPAVCLFVAFFFLKNEATAQLLSPQPDTGFAVKKLFKNPDKVLWVKYFQGRLDELNDVVVALGTDGREAKGFLTYLESKTQFRLDGTLSGADFLLRELDAKGQTSGKLLGKLETKALRAEWVNADATISMRLDAHEVKSPDRRPSDCGADKWTRRYEAVENGQVVELALRRSAGGNLSGSVWFPALKTTHLFRGKTTAAGDFNLFLKNTTGESTGKMSGKWEENASSQPINWTAENEAKSLIFRQIEANLAGCAEWADFSTSYDVQFPKIKNEAANRWFEKRAADWMSRCRQQAENHPTEPLPANRASRRATGWTEILLWDERLFCGFLNFQNSWDESLTTSETFNFDLETGQNIELGDLFIKNFEYGVWLDQWVGREKLNLPRSASDADFRSWVAREPFSIWTIRREGLAFSTRFSPIFGQPTVVVGWSALRPYLKKGSAVGAFVR